MGVEGFNAIFTSMGGKNQEDMRSHPTAGMAMQNILMSLATTAGTVKPKATHAASMYPPMALGPQFPLEHAAFARVQRSPLLAKLGERLSIQRVEVPHSRRGMNPRTNRGTMDNQLATMLMIDVDSGFAPMEWQNGVGDTYIYKAVSAEYGRGDLQHLSSNENGAIWDYITGRLGSGEFVSDADPEDFGKIAKYMNSN